MRSCQLASQLVGHPLVVSIKERDKCPSSGCYSSVSRNRNSSVYVMTQPAYSRVIDPPIAFCELMRRAVIDNYDLPVLVALSKHDIDGPTHCSWVIKKRDHHADVWLRLIHRISWVRHLITI